MTARISLKNWLSGRTVTGNAAAGALLESDPNNRYTPGSGALSVNLGGDRAVDVVAVMRWDLSAAFSASVQFRRNGSRVGADVTIAGTDAPLVYVALDNTRTVDQLTFVSLDGALCALFAGAWVDISIPPDVGGGGGIVLNTDGVAPVSGNAYLSYFPPLRRADFAWSNLTESEAAAIYSGVDYAYRNRATVFALPDAGNIRESQTAVMGMIDSFAAPARTDEGVSGTSIGLISIRAEAATAPAIPTEVSQYPRLLFSQSAVFMREGATVSLTLALSSEPENNLTVSLVAAPAFGLTLSRSSFNFTRANYATAQTFTVRALHDSNNAHIQHALTASGTGLAGPGTITVNVFDDDTGAVTPTASLLASTNGGLSWHGPGVLFERTPNQAVPDFMLRAVLSAALPVDVRVNLRFTGTAAASVRESDASFIDVSAGQTSADIEFPLGAPGSAASLRARVNSGTGYTANTRTVWMDWSS